MSCTSLCLLKCSFAAETGRLEAEPIEVSRHGGHIRPIQKIAVPGCILYSRTLFKKGSRPIRTDLEIQKKKEGRLDLDLANSKAVYKQCAL